jgi:hypothetical protein
MVSYVTIINYVMIFVYVLLIIMSAPGPVAIPVREYKVALSSLHIINVCSLQFVSPVS